MVEVLHPSLRLKTRGVSNIPIGLPNTEPQVWSVLGRSIDFSGSEDLQNPRCERKGEDFTLHLFVLRCSMA